MELWEDTSASKKKEKFWVRVLYDDVPVKVGGEKARRRGDMIAWESFRKAILKVYPFNYDTDCQRVTNDV
jgi:hypothetical protein